MVQVEAGQVGEVAQFGRDFPGEVVETQVQGGQALQGAELGGDGPAYFFVPQVQGPHPSPVDFHPGPGGDVGRAGGAPGKQRVVVGQPGVVGMAGPVVADGRQHPAVRHQFRVVARVGYVGAVGASGGIQVGYSRLGLRGRPQGEGRQQPGRAEDQDKKLSGFPHW